jgi:hypothetical protein
VAVRSADTSGDGLLSLQELSDWINEKIQEHINEALRENFGLFVSIDNKPRNGKLVACVLYKVAYGEIQGMHITEYGRRLYLKVSGLAEFMCHNV